MASTAGMSPPKSIRTIAVTGASGLVGGPLVKRLLLRGDPVRCLVRTKAQGRELAAAGAQWVTGTLEDAGALRALVAGCDGVFHLAGLRRATARADFFRVNVDGTRALCEAMVEAGPGRLVLAGSLGASGPSTPERPRLESDPLAPADWYGESKAEAERVAFSFRDRLEVTCIRPVRIFGPGDRQNLPFFKIVSRGLMLSLGGPPRPVAFVDVEDVVDLCLLLLDRDEAKGEAFFCTGGESTLLGIQQEVARALGVTPRRLTVPPAVLKGVALLADGASKLTGRALPLDRNLARQLLVPAWTCSGEKAQRLLGHSATRSLSESVARTARWYAAHGWLPPRSVEGRSSVGA